MRNAIYIMSLVIFAISIFLILNYPESGKRDVIAGGLVTIGLLLNIIGFSMPKKT